MAGKTRPFFHLNPDRRYKYNQGLIPLASALTSIPVTQIVIEEEAWNRPYRWCTWNQTE